MGLSNTQHREIMFRYDQTRMKNQRTLDQRYETLFEEVPELKQIQNDILDLSLNQARQELLCPENAEQAKEAYRRQRQALLARKTASLTEHGYPADYLDAIYDCPDCQDTGYIHNQPCHCLRHAITLELYKSSNLIHILEEENFDTFDETYYNDTETHANLSLTPRENIKRVRDVCLDFVRHFDDVYDNLIFYGPTGVGKTFLTHCIAKQLLDTSHTVLYLTSLQLFDILEKNKFNKEDASTSNEQISYILHSDLLIIDDLGTELVNSFTASQLFYFIEERHIRQRSTIISTNLSFQELRDRYSERIFSRFTGYYNFLMIVGEDIRIRKALRQ